MIRDEAIKILCPETSLSALADYAERSLEYMEAYLEACRMAVDALRAQPEPNPPLTLEELMEMDGEPVWVYEYTNYQNNCWGRIWAKASSDEICFCVITSNKRLYFTNYGKTWLAYRRKPEEGRKMFDEIDGVETLHCPYCGREQYTHEDDDISSDMCLTECEHCGKSFWYSVEVVRTYYPRKDEEE